MRIRKGIAEDAGRIKSLVEENNEMGEFAKGLGFYEMPMLDIEEYERRLKDNPLVFVGEKNNQVVGFILGYTDESLYKVRADHYIAQYLLNKPKPFVFLSEIAIKKGLQGKRLGEKLFKAVMKETEDTEVETVWTSIVHKPVKNKRSPSLIKKFGFELESELDVPEINITFGIYKKEL